MQQGYLFVAEFNLLTCRFLLVRMGLKFPSLSDSLKAIPSYLQRLVLLQTKLWCKLFLQDVL